MDDNKPATEDEMYALLDNCLHTTSLTAQDLSGLATYIFTNSEKFTDILQRHNGGTKS